jgi:hypothetical protein
MMRAEKQLSLLCLFFYSFGVSAGLLACLFLPGTLGLVAAKLLPGIQSPTEMDPLIVQEGAFLLGLLLVGLGGAGATFWICTGRFLATRRHYLFCVSVARVSLFFVPLGTVLAVLTLRALAQKEALQLFQHPQCEDTHPIDTAKANARS